jgi:hypothetical protein
MGYDKGGFHNYDWGEQIAGLDPVHNVNEIRPEWQSLRVGDVVHPMPGGDWTVVVLEPNRALVLDNPAVTPTDWTWASELRPVDGGHQTRLVTRIRNHKGTFFSYALDVPDLILFPRLLMGVKQRAEGTLPGMPGTHTGEPFPIARLPVHGWAALAWITGLAIFAASFRRVLGLGDWGRPRRHPHLVFWLGFVIGAGYLLMSDTPPIQFFTHTWGLGLILGTASGMGIANRAGTDGSLPEGERRRYVSRAVVALVETGLFVILPATAVWQAATARGWTTSPLAHLAVGSTAALVAVAVATLAWGPARGRRRAAWTAALFAVAYSLSGSGTAALLAAVISELVRPHQPIDATRPSAGPQHAESSHELSVARS